MEDILARLRTRLTDDNSAPDDDVLLDCIESAKEAILARRFPTQERPVNAKGETFVEQRYLDLQFRMAMDLYNKQGAEGELAHSENGINRTFESPWISKQLLEEVVPYCGVVR